MKNDQLMRRISLLALAINGFVATALAQSAVAAPPAPAKPAAESSASDLDEPSSPSAKSSGSGSKNNSNTKSRSSEGFGFGGTRGTGEYSAPAAGVVTFRVGKRDAVPPVVVEFTERDPAVLQQLDEDLSVMGHLIDQALEKGLGEEAPPSKMGVPLIYTGGSRSARAIYLEGFGALFMIKVNLPLLGPPEPPPQNTSKPANSEWESARQEVLGMEERGLPIVGASEASDTPFDRDEVEALKRILIGAMKNAANIRHLQPDDYVSVAVFGQPVPPFTVDSGDDSPASKRRSGSSSKQTKPSRAVTANPYLYNSPAGMKGTVLTLRVKVSDTRAFAEDKLSFAEFEKRVSTHGYAAGGHGVVSVNSWIQSGRSSSSNSSR
jgi:hypothetical protein